VQPPLGGSDGDSENGGDLGDRPLFEVMQGKDGTLVGRQPVDGPAEGVARNDGLETGVVLTRRVVLATIVDVTAVGASPASFNHTTDFHQNVHGLVYATMSLQRRI